MLTTTQTTTTKNYITLLILHALLYRSIEAGKLQGGYSIGTFNPGIIGNYAGHLSGGEALSSLEQQHHEGDFSVESHDFSDVGGGDYGQHESLHQLGDHLSADHFPADFDAKHYHEGQEEAHERYDDAESNASELHDQIEVHGDLEAHTKIKEQNFDHDEHEKPVMGIDHGHGAYSYSTTYGEHKPEEQQQLQEHGQEQGPSLLDSY